MRASRWTISRLLPRTLRVKAETWQAEILELMEANGVPEENIGKVLDLSITPWLVLIYIAFIQWKEALFLLAIYPLIIIFMIILS